MDHNKLCKILKEMGMPVHLTCLPRNLSAGKESICNAGDTHDAGSIPGLGRSPREGNGNPLQYSGLKNPMDREAWWAKVHGVTKESDMI